MILGKNKLNCIITSVIISIPLFCTNNVYAENSAMGLPEVSNIIQRPKWLPELPAIDTKGFAPDTAVYLSVRKKILEKGDKTAVKELHTLAQRGHVASIVLMGYLYDQVPKMVKTNPTTAGKYWAIAAKSGDSVALYNLGILYLNGRGVPKNIETANQLFNMSAKGGMYRANYILGQMSEGQKKWGEAIKNYSQCMVSKPLIQCKTRYSILSITKTKLNADTSKKVIEALTLASNGGDLEATYTLARLSADGIIVTKSPVAMVYYLEGMINSPITTPYYRKLAANMYRLYNPTEDQIIEGKKNYRIATAGGVNKTQLLSYRPIDTTKTVIEKGSNLQ